jgi:hypothetical protein
MPTSLTGRRLGRSPALLRRGPILDPVDRVSEILFGLIMTLTVSGTLRVADAGRDDIRAMLIAALGCNLAWGVIDAVFYLLETGAERGENLESLRALRDAAPEAAHGLLREAMPPLLASQLTPEELEALRQRLLTLPPPPALVRLQRRDWLGALGIFLLVFGSTLPVVLPFLFVTEARLALHVSNGIAIVLLYLAGHALGRVSGRPPYRVGLAMVLIGAALVAMTIALGG